MFFDTRYDEAMAESLPAVSSLPLARPPSSPPGGRQGDAALFPCSTGSAADGAQKLGVAGVTGTQVAVMTQGTALFWCCCAPSVVASGQVADLVGVACSEAGVALSFADPQGAPFRSALAGFSSATVACAVEPGSPPSTADGVSTDPLLAHGPTSGGAGAAGGAAGLGTRTVEVTTQHGPALAEAVRRQHARLVAFGGIPFPGAAPAVGAASAEEAAKLVGVVIASRSGPDYGTYSAQVDRALKQVTRYIADGSVWELGPPVPPHVIALLMGGMQPPAISADLQLPSHPAEAALPPPALALTRALHPALRVLHVRRHGGFAVEGKDYSPVAQRLASCIGLVELGLTESPLATGPFGQLAAAAPAAGLHVLDLSGSSLAPTALSALAALVGRARQLRTLRLARNPGIGSLDPVADALCLPAPHPFLETLDADECDVSIGPRLICASRVLPRLTDLAVMNGAVFEDSPAACEQLALGHRITEASNDMLRNAPHLLGALLVGNAPLALRLVHPVAPQFVQALATFDHSRRSATVHINASGMTAEPSAAALHHLLEAVAPLDGRPTTVTGLDLSYMFRNTPEFAPLAQRALTAAPNLKVLSLAGGFPAEGEVRLPVAMNAQCQMAALADNQWLTSLDITGNALGDGPVVALGQALRRNRTLTALHFDDNLVGMAGLAAIRGALYGNRKLIDMPLPQKDIDRVLADLLSKHRHVSSQESLARMQMKSAFRARSRGRAMHHKFAMVGHIRERKRLAREQDKFNKLITAIREAVAASMATVEGRRRAKEAEQLAKFQAREAEREQRRAQRAAERAAARAGERAAAREAAQQHRRALQLQARQEDKQEARRGYARMVRPPEVSRATWQRDRVCVGLQRARDQHFASAMAVGNPGTTVAVDQVIPQLEAQYRAGYQQYEQRCAAVAAAPLPAGWEALTDPGSGRPYFVCRARSVSTWADPRVVNPAAPLPQFHSASVFGAGYAASGALLSPEQRYAYQLMEACHNQCFIVPPPQAPAGGAPPAAAAGWNPQPQYYAPLGVPVAAQPLPGAPVVGAVVPEPLGAQAPLPLGWSTQYDPQQHQPQQFVAQTQQHFYQPLGGVPGQPAAPLPGAVPPQSPQVPTFGAPLAPAPGAVLAPTAFLRYFGYQPHHKPQPQKQQPATGGAPWWRRPAAAAAAAAAAGAVVGVAATRPRRQVWYSSRSRWDTTGDYYWDDPDCSLFDSCSDSGDWCDDRWMWDDSVDGIFGGDDNPLEGLCDAFDHIAEMDGLCADDWGGGGDPFDDLGGLDIELDIDGYAGGGADVSEDDGPPTPPNGGAAEEVAAAGRQPGGLRQAPRPPEDEESPSEVDGCAASSGHFIPSVVGGSASTVATSDGAQAWLADGDFSCDDAIDTDANINDGAAAPSMRRLDAEAAIWATPAATSDELLVRYVAELVSIAAPGVEAVPAIDWQAPGDRCGPLGFVSVVTQCTADRLDRLEELLLSLSHGAGVCAAVYEPEDETDRANLPSVLAAMCARVTAAPGATLGHVKLFVARRDPARRLYPINACRNIALDAATTDVVLLLDIDFALSRETCPLLAADAARLRGELLRSKTAFVLPAFELHHDTSKTRCKITDLQTLCESLKCGQATPFHVRHYPAGHRATGYDDWLAKSRSPTSPIDGSYPVEYEVGYEPYVLCNRAAVPRYDGRFAGYGLNKVQHLFHMAAAGFSFEVLPRCFVAARVHPRSRDWNISFGLGEEEAVDDDEAFPFEHVAIDLSLGERPRLHRLLVQGLFDKFRAETSQWQI